MLRINYTVEKNHRLLLSVGFLCLKMRCPKVITMNDLDYKNLSSNFELRIGSKKSENLDEIEFCDITVKAI